MKYLLQQMLAFFVIILTVLIIFGISFTTFTRNTVVENTYKQLEGYADTVLNNMHKQEWNFKQSLDTTVAILQNQKVGFYVLNTDLTASYPVEFEGQYGGNLVSKEEVDILKKGNVIKKTVTDKSLINGKQNMALYLQPLFNTPSLTFEGILIVSQPNSSIESSISALTGNLFKGFILSTIISLFISYILAKFQVNRIDRMRKATNQLAKGNFDVHLESNHNDELDDLAEDFNQMAVALKESHVEIERQEERRRNFMADVAHEMRTPLTTINGLLEGLAYGAIPLDQEEKCLTLMQNETKRLIRLVNENLDYEKILTNQIRMAVRKFDATDTLDLVVEQLKGKASEKNNQLVLNTTEPVTIYADYDRFIQIMVNIITNAIQFTENGEILIDTHRGYKETRISITDTGIGMSEEELKNIWDRYYKADPSRKNTKYGESGLGLSIVNQLVRLHGGTIDVKSSLGQGTKFTVSLPDSKPEQTVENTSYVTSDESSLKS